MIPLTEEQKEAVDHPDSLALVSCPGSGKTRTIVAKLLRCIEEVRGTPRRIACITFTVAGVKEVESRMRLLSTYDDSKHCEVSTIHAFCLNNILRPHAHLLPHLNGDWEIVTSDDEWFTKLVDELARRYRIDRGAMEDFEKVQRTLPDGAPTKTRLPIRAVNEFFQRLDAERKVTLNGIVFFSAKLVDKHPFIASKLAARFAWYIVDEFQDTTVAQAILLLRIFQQKRSKMFIVGDPNQSILSVAGARPSLMEEFAAKIGARTDCKLTGNYRCSQLIVAKAELLCPTIPPMRAVGDHREFKTPPMYQHCLSPVEAIIEHFLPAMDELGISAGDAAVLAPWWTDLPPIAKELRRRGIPVVGPGSRPYRRWHEFALLAETLAAYLAVGTCEAAAAVQKALFVTLSEVTDTAVWSLYKYSGRCVVFRLINAARAALESHEGIAEWLQETASECETILIAEELLTESNRGVFVNSAIGMINDMIRNKVDVPNTPAIDLGMAAMPKNSVHLMTMHSSKGQEFDAVAVVSLHDNKVPFFGCSTDEERLEYRRLLFVATTRARKLLMFFTDACDSRNGPSPYLGRDGLAML